jgi:hypothetical protein
LVGAGPPECIPTCQSNRQPEVARHSFAQPLRAHDSMRRAR